MFAAVVLEKTAGSSASGLRAGAGAAVAGPAARCSALRRSTRSGESLLAHSPLAMLVGSSPSKAR